MYFIKLATLSSHSHHSHRLYTRRAVPTSFKALRGPGRPKSIPHAKGVFHLVSREMPQRIRQLATCCFPKQGAVFTGVLVHTKCEQDLRLTAVTRRIRAISWSFVSQEFITLILCDTLLSSPIYTRNLRPRETS